MKRTVIAVAIASVAILGWNPAPASAQEKSARGTVTAVGADSVTVKVQNADMTFAVDAKTNVEAPGAGTAARAAERRGQGGAKLSDVVKVGQAVEVTYAEAAGKMTASKIKGITAAVLASGQPNTTATATTDSKSSSGTVKTIAANSMTITGSSGGGASFTQTFAIDSDTKVIGKGAGTAAAARGGKTVVTDLVGAGDVVSVSYKSAGTTLTATEIRVTTKAAK